MKKHFRRIGTLESRFYLFFILIFFATILTMQIISTRFTLKSVQDSTLGNNRLLLKELVNLVDAYIKNVDHISKTVINDPDTQTFLTSEDAKIQKVLSERLLSYIKARDDISSIIIFKENGQTVSGNKNKTQYKKDFRDTIWYRNAVYANGGTAVSTAYVQNLVPGEYSWVVSLSTRIFDSTHRPTGVLLVDLKFNRIQELCKSLVIGRKGYNFIIDPNGNYIFHPSLQLVYSNLKSEPVDELLKTVSRGDSFLKKDNANYLIAKSERTGWYVVGVSFTNDYISGWPYVQTMNALIGLVLFLIVGLVTNFITRGITKPLRKLQDVMKSVETGEFLKAEKIEGTDEIRELAREYNLMVGRIGELMEANIKEQELKRKSDLKALQAQIHPHFLYNTLDSIIWMGEMNQCGEVVKMTSALSKLFRISISKGREFIPLKDELEHVRSYLTIQQMRYKNRFRYLLDIPEELLDCRILKITLQPLVENAIYHGIRSVDYEGIIEIRGMQKEDNLILIVKDNGKGLDVEKLTKSIVAQEDTEGKEHGTGVRNVNERLKLYYGEEYGLTFSTPEKGGTEIIIRIPCRKGIGS